MALVMSPSLGVAPITNDAHTRMEMTPTTVRNILFTAPPDG